VHLAARLTALPPALSLLLIGGFLLCLALAGIRLRRRCISHADLNRDLAAAGVLLNIAGLLYTLLLAFMVVGVWESYNRAEAATDLEAASLMTIYRLAQAYPGQDAQAQALGAAVRNYAASVVHQEFPAMARMRRSPETARAIDALWQAASALDPRSPREANLQDMVLRQMDIIDEARVTRLYTANRGMPGSLWAVVLSLTGLTLGLSLFVSTAGAWQEKLLLGALALAAALVIFTVVQLNYPFVGHVRVPEEGFDELLNLPALPQAPSTAPAAAAVPG
jgi:hypothetical protein